MTKRPSLSRAVGHELSFNVSRAVWALTFITVTFTETTFFFLGKTNYM